MAELEELSNSIPITKVEFRIGILAGRAFRVPISYYFYC